MAGTPEYDDEAELKELADLFGELGALVDEAVDRRHGRSKGNWIRTVRFSEWSRATALGMTDSCGLSRQRGTVERRLESVLMELAAVRVELAQLRAEVTAVAEQMSEQLKTEAEAAVESARAAAEAYRDAALAQAAEIVAAARRTADGIVTDAEAAVRWTRDRGPEAERANRPLAHLSGPMPVRWPREVPTPRFLLVCLDGSPIPSECGPRARHGECHDAWCTGFLPEVGGRDARGSRGATPAAARGFGMAPAYRPMWANGPTAELRALLAPETAPSDGVSATR